MTKRMKHMIVGVVISTSIGIAAGYGLARMVESRAPTDVKSAWDAYAVAQRSYMAGVC